MKFFLKQLVGALASPLVFAALIALAACVLWKLNRRRAAAWVWASAALAVYLSAIAPIGNALIAPLETMYAPLQVDGTLPAVHLVVVLGSSYVPHDRVPITAALDGDGLARVVEGVRIARRLTATRLVLSGGSPSGGQPSALGYTRLARDLGVSETSLVVLDRALDTASEAASVAAVAGKAPFILVTSAYHMPRAMRLMQRAGAHPIPAPTAHLWEGGTSYGLRSLQPTSGGLRKTERALHEYVGLAAMAVHAD
ncbi:MAG: ElyC/SanA/YdcF family protein [Gammaproteobacteria bacterium]